MAGSYAAQKYAERLDQAIKRAGFSVRGLARHMSPESPESARANLHRYLRGEHLPGPLKRIEFAAVLQDESLRQVDAGEDDDEELALMQPLMRALEDIVEKKFETKFNELRQGSVR